MKRLFKLMKGMREDTSTYTAMYDGTVFIPQPGENPDERSRDTLYFDGEIGYDITPSGRGEADRPTVVIQIPCDTLGIDRFTASSADFCLRAFIPYIDGLNSDFSELSSSLEKLGDEIGMKVHVMHEDIFNSMHRI